MELLDSLNQQYPCTKRLGYGGAKPCNCAKDGVLNKSLISCDLFGNVMPVTCCDCGYQNQEKMRR